MTAHDRGRLCPRYPLSDSITNDDRMSAGAQQDGARLQRPFYPWSLLRSAMARVPNISIPFSINHKLARSLLERVCLTGCEVIHPHEESKWQPQEFLLGQLVPIGAFKLFVNIKIIVDGIAIVVEIRGQHK